MFVLPSRSALLAVAFAVCGCGLDPMCGDQVVFADTSPDGKYVATVWQRDCGTPGAGTHVTLRPSAQKFTARVEDVVFTVDGLMPVGVFWAADSQLSVECIRCAPDRIVRQQASWQDVAIAHVSYGAAKKGQ